MRLGKFVKSPSERKRYKINYADWLDVSETVSNVVYSTSPDNVLVADGSEIAGDGKSVTFYVSGGTLDTTYDLFVLMTTSGGQVKEDFIIFVVEEQG